MAPKDKKGAKKAVTTDSRFASLHNDPKFAPTRRNDLKVKVDSRFSKEELGLQNSKAKIDRYGRKLKDQKSTKDFDKFYEQEDDLEAKVASPSSSSDSDSNSDSHSTDDEDGTKFVDRARGEGGSDEDDSSSSSEEEESEEEDYAEDSELEIEEEEVAEGDPTSTIAVTNMDWDHLRAVDLLATFSSFVPPKGFIDSVTIYPSEFGKERMQREEIEGPPRDVFASKKSKKEESDDDSDDDDIDLEKAAKQLYEEGDAQDYDSKSLRRYQLQRLRYYYAIVVCDSVATAKAIYDSCDGTEYESTANHFDLRYVPEGMEFEEDDVKDRCRKIPANYKPQDFITDALQHSKVKLTWDETPAERMTLSKKAFSQKEIEDMDFKAYLASDSEESDAEDLKQKYKSLAGVAGSGKQSKPLEEEEGDDLDMEITFTPGLAEATAEEKEESTIDKIKNKEKERRKQRKQKLKELKKQQEETKRTSKKERRSKKTEEGDDKVSREELELLMLDENEEEAKKGRSHFNMKEIIKSEKEKSRKHKGKGKGKRASNDSGDEASNDLDIVDSRFSEVFEDHRFAIDPTSSEYKNTPVMKKILQERSKRSMKRSKEDSHKKRRV
ncbi:unnamed protein product [Kuraishia capsulata CBS 1993]|uniref:NUC153 domain-containing protein n=1 Tax=Kuraishia capsulata CBS 1993 TaxID=1382522 RepID=W6MU82_9ASCO|nr:uncharacterized protein KUCA_T00001460001 [Kuraishia capsulata CBS 1993]CDK25490.1 unnamed protein product [Kuraishia capsulata CBS 1993]